VEDRKAVIVRRRGAKDVALIPADELAGLMETAHLDRSPKNAGRLLTALRRADDRQGKPESPDKLRRELGPGPARWAGGAALRIFQLIEAVLKDPFTGIGKPEPLKFVLAGAWARRI